MKLKFILSTIAASAIAFGSIATFSQPSSAQRGETVYFCAKSSTGIPTTYARTPSGKRIPLIRWQKPWSNEFTPEKRCQIVSQKFQKADEEGVLNYLTSGVFNDLNVICATRRYGGQCDRVLFTLSHRENPNEVLGALVGVAYRASRPAIISGGPSPRDYYDATFMINQKSRSSAESRTLLIR